MTEYDRLDEVVVGVETFEKTRKVDYTLKLFFRDNIHDYYHDEDFIEYNISEQIIEERKQDLDNLARVLEDNDVTVMRPTPCNGLKTTRTPHFNSISYSNSNVRDLCLTLDDLIICSFSSVRSRYFENIQMYDILLQKMQQGVRVITAPLPTVQFDKIDSSRWQEFDLDVTHGYYHDKEILFDAANCIKVTDRDILMNIGNKNAYNGYLWLKSMLPENIQIHPVKICDNHIDGTLLPLREGVFLVNTCFLDYDIKSKLPDKFKNWDVIVSNEKKLNKQIYDQSFLTGPELATWEGMDINLLSISTDTVVIQDTFERAGDMLAKYNFNVISIPFRHSTIFGGGVHCSTLDIKRTKV